MNQMLVRTKGYFLKSVGPRTLYLPRFNASKTQAISATAYLNKEDDDNDVVVSLTLVMRGGTRKLNYDDALVKLTSSRVLLS